MNLYDTVVSLNIRYLERKKETVLLMAILLSGPIASFSLPPPPPPPPPPLSTPGAHQKAWKRDQFSLLHQQTMTHAAYVYDIEHVIVDNLQFMTSYLQ